MGNVSFLGVPLPSGYFMLAKLPIIVSIVSIIAYMAITKTIKAKREHAHNSLYYGPNYKDRQTIRQFISRATGCADNDQAVNAYYNMTHKEKKKQHKIKANTETTKSAQRRSEKRQQQERILKKGSSSSTSSGSSAEAPLV